VSVVAVALTALGVIGAMVAFAWWLARWARGSDQEALAESTTARGLQARVDELGRSVEDRDRTLSSKDDELGRERAARAAAEKHRDDALALVEKLAAKSPALLAGAVRSEFDRLRSLSQVPPAAAGPAAPPGRDP